MKSSITVSVRSLVTTVGVAAALVLAYLVGALQGEDASAAEEVDAASPPTIVMSGTGTATGVPDQLSFRVGVTPSLPTCPPRSTRPAARPPT